jgi:chromosome segregation ATPase
MSARVEELGNEISSLTQEIAEAEAMDVEATKVRQGENEQATAAIKEYQEAQELVQRVIGVLNEFYSKQKKAKETNDLLQSASAADPPKTFEGEYTGKDAGGIMSILEISLSDFSRLEAETKTAEQQAAAEYQKLMHESAVRKATLKKDLEYKSTEKQKLEGDIQRSGAELAGYKEELAAVLQYIEKLKPSCTNAAPSHEERKERRQKEIASLQEALEILNSEGN